MRWAALFLGLALAAQEPVPLAPAADRIQAVALAFVQEQAAHLPGTYAFKVTRPPLLPRAVAGDLAFEPARLSRQELTGRFFLTVAVTSGDRNLGLVRVDLEGRWSGKLLRAKRPLARRSEPGPEDLEAFDFEGVPPPGALREPPRERRLREPVPAGHLLTAADLEAVPLVKTGDPVRLHLEDGDLTVVVDTVAKSGGAAGDTVRLEMPSSRKVVQAVVLAPGEARLQRK